MSWRVLVDHDFPRGGLAIRAGLRHDENRFAVLRWPGPPQLEMVDLPIGVASEPDPRDILHIPEELGRPLLDALSAHYGGATDVRNLRRDYDAERARVDLMIASFVDNERSRTDQLLQYLMSGRSQ